ncbi:MAG: homocysteine S-methyltransferase family protein [Nitrosarchaeum sp.]
MVEKESFLDALKNRILLFDGAMGTEIQKYNPKPEDFPNNQDGFNDGLIITHPDWIKQIHRNYLDAGSDCIETNSFGSNKIKLDEYGFGDQTVDFNKKIAQLAVEVCSEYTDKPRYVIGSMGPSGYLPSSNDPDLGKKPLAEIRNAFELQAEGLILGGVDALLIETSQDILEVKLVIEASHNAMKKIGKKVPIIANTTLDQYGKMLLGTNIQAAYTTVSDMGIDVFGLNCSTGPIEMAPSIGWLDEQNEHNLLVVPNAGMPENQGGQAVYKMTPEKMGQALGDFLKQYKKIRIIGGCCGTNPEHIAVLRKVIDEKDYSVKG